MKGQQNQKTFSTLQNIKIVGNINVFSKQMFGQKVLVKLTPNA
jgi:hypothetical protein